MLNAGDVILNGKYRVERLLGKGAFARVYLARHLELDVERAVKLLSRDAPGVGSTQFDDYHDRFRQEARLGARLEHPHVVKVYDFEAQEGVLYLVMEHVAGGSLADLLAQGPLSLDDFMRIALDAATGLGVIHERLEIVHRDVKPSNILLTAPDRQGRRRAKVGDLGLAQVEGGLSRRSMLGSEAAPHPGTPLYMSPEQGREYGYLQYPSDVYSLGCVMFEMLTGKAYKKRRPGTRVRDLRADAPEWLDELVARCLVRERDERPWDGNEVAELLRAGEQEARKQEARRQEASEQEAREREVREREAREKVERERRERGARERARRAREAAAAREAKLAALRERAEAALAKQRWPEAQEAAQDWLEMEPEAQRATEILAQARRMLEGPPLRRTPSGLVIATPENLAWLLGQPAPPERVWWEKTEIEFCLVPAGEFLMGSPEGEGRDDERPRHTVYLDAYYVGRYPVTQAQYARFVQETDHCVPFVEANWARPYNWNQKRKTPPRGKENHPVVLVSWEDAVIYCEWAGLRLPTEAEWEKAARGTDRRTYPWGDEWDAERCNTSEGGKGGTTPVGAYSPRGDSPYGCADVAGNVWEWCADWYGGDYYSQSPSRNPQGPDSGALRVLRGGAWNNDRYGARSAFRLMINPDFRNIRWGFRCCVSPPSFL